MIKFENFIKCWAMKQEQSHTKISIDNITSVLPDYTKYKQFYIKYFKPGAAESVKFQ